MSSAKAITANLKGLTPSSRRLFRQLALEYRVTDGGGQQVLLSGLHAKDQAEAAEAIVAKDGRLLVDRFGQSRAHPLLATIRDFRSQWTAALRQLNLAIGDPPKVGRPQQGA